MKNKRDLELAISLFLGCQKFRNFFSDPSPGYFWSFNSKKFLSYSENYNWQFIQVISCRDNYSIFNLIFKS